MARARRVTALLVGASAGMARARRKASRTLAGKTVRHGDRQHRAAPTTCSAGRSRVTSAGTCPAIRSVVPQNMPGAGGLVAANYLYNVAPKDGTVIAIFNKGVAGAAIAGVAGGALRRHQDDVARHAVHRNRRVLRLQLAAPEVRTIEDLYENGIACRRRWRRLVSHIYPKALNALLGTEVQDWSQAIPAAPDLYRHGARRGRRILRRHRRRHRKTARPGFRQEQIIAAAAGRRRAQSRSQGRSLTSSITHAPPTTGSRSNISMRRKASAARSPRRPILRRRSARCCATPSIGTMQDAGVRRRCQERQGFDPRPENGDYLAAI